MPLVALDARRNARAIGSRTGSVAAPPLAFSLELVREEQAGKGRLPDHNPSLRGPRQLAETSEPGGSNAVTRMPS